VPDRHIDPLVAELGKGAGLQPIVAALEEGAGFMADGYARVSSRFGVCMCIGGPEAGNLPGNSRTWIAMEKGANHPLPVRDSVFPTTRTCPATGACQKGERGYVIPPATDR
jgi:hypothetical protein